MAVRTAEGDSNTSTSTNANTSESTTTTNNQTTNKKAKAPSILSYPQDGYQRADHEYIRFDVVEYKAPGFGVSEKGNFSFSLPTGNQSTKDGIDLGTSKVSSYIILPLPKAISDGQGASWGDNSINAAAAAGYAGGTAATQGNIMSTVEQILQKFQGEVGQNSQSLASGAVGLAIQNLIGQEVDINSIVSRQTGQIINPNVELLFNGVQLRGGFNFSFDLMPRSESEAIQIKLIIRAFKQNMMPTKSSAGGLFVNSPKVFRVSYMKGTHFHPFLNKFKICALTNMSVDYTGSGQYSSYYDGTPIHMVMNLQFQELSPIYSEDYDTLDGLHGVGY
jgi:hypothetical protein